jgi:hypothetical protein
MEEVKNENVNDIEEIEEVELIPEDSETVNILPIIIGAGSAVVAGVAAIAYKNRAKIEEWKINRLRKKGYTIYKNEEVVEVEEDESVEEDDK